MAKPHKIILVNLYSPDTIARYLLSSYVLKAYLKEDIEILNFSTQEDEAKIRQEIIKNDPDIVGYSCYIWNIEKIQKIAKKIKLLKKIVQIFGGPEISLKRIESLKYGDYYVIGQGEKKFLNLISYLKSGGAAPPKGIAYWQNNKIKYAHDDENINLEEVPSVYLSGVLPDNLYKYQQAFLETQRGCKFRCKYCVYHKSLAQISYYPPERIFKELEFLVDQKQILALRIFDAIFTSDMDRAKGIVKYLLKLKRPRLAWIFWEMTPFNIDEEFIKLTAAFKTQKQINNCDQLMALDRPQLYSDMLKGYTVINSVGIQSFYEPALRSISRIVVSRDRFENFMSLVNKHNIVLKLDIILGLPFETFISYLQGLEFILPYFKNTDHVLNIHRLQILPGSELENSSQDYKIKYYKKAPHLVLSTNAMTQEELNKAAKLTAVLFRIVNSPLRNKFFKAKERSQKDFLMVVGDITDLIEKQFNGIKLIMNQDIDDNYWYKDVYQEIPSQWLADILSDYKNNS